MPDGSFTGSISARRRRYLYPMTTREKAERLLKEMPEEQVPAALDALEESLSGKVCAMGAR